MSVLIPLLKEIATIIFFGSMGLAAAGFILYIGAQIDDLPGIRFLNKIIDPFSIGGILIFIAYFILAVFVFVII